MSLIALILAYLLGKTGTGANPSYTSQPQPPQPQPLPQPPWPQPGYIPTNATIPTAMPGTPGEIPTNATIPTGIPGVEIPAAPPMGGIPGWNAANPPRNPIDALGGLLSTMRNAPLPTPAETPPAGAPPPPPPPPPPPGVAQAQLRTYTVAPSDTAVAVAARFNGGAQKRADGKWIWKELSASGLKTTGAQPEPWHQGLSFSLPPTWGADTGVRTGAKGAMKSATVSGDELLVDEDCLDEVDDDSIAGVETLDTV